MQQEIAELKKSLEDSQASQRTLTSELVDLRSVLEQRSSELDTVKKKMNREISIGPGIQDLGSSLSGSPQSPSSKYDLGAAQNKITGLKYAFDGFYNNRALLIFHCRRHIVQELQKENQIATQRNKLLESENKLLASEAEQLRQVIYMTVPNAPHSLFGLGNEVARR